MRLDDVPESSNIEDRRGEGPMSAGPGGPGFGLPIGRGMGIGTIIVIGLIAWAMGMDPRMIIGMLVGGNFSSPSQVQQPYSPPSTTKTGTPTDALGRDVARILRTTEIEWKKIFDASNATYRNPTLVMFNGQTNANQCGLAQTAMGPFYCPPDQKIYLDTSFFRELERRFRGCDGASCKFAQAYVIAHEVGHHVQNQLGILPKVQQQQRGMSKTEANRLQVRVELQADCLAGVWANHAGQDWKNLIEAGDVEAALQTAAAIGDDRLQKQAQGYVVPDSFTHGSSEQRQRWFATGYRQGTVAACNTFTAAQL
jgi:predicted metalloprotease